MKPIETRYRGWRFRSRLEARWAVFFDALGAEWVYEPEGFDLGVAGWYLPDFWLPQVRMWAEVKPEWPPRNEQVKCSVLAHQSGYPCLLLVGVPDNKAYWAEEPGPEPWEYCLTNEHGYLTEEGRFFSNPSPGDDQFEDTARAAAAARSFRFDSKQGALL